MNPPDNRLDQPHLDNRLRQLATAAQQCSPGSLAKRRALTQLILVLQRSGKLCRPRQGQFQLLYEDIYAEALQRLFSFICERIDDYNPQKGEVLQWVNFLLSQRFFATNINIRNEKDPAARLGRVLKVQTLYTRSPLKSRADLLKEGKYL
jgi:hypothetical protein